MDGINAVRLAHFTPEPFGKSLLQNLHKAGLKDPVLKGGALYGDYFRNVLGLAMPPRDYDISAGLDMEKVFGKNPKPGDATDKLAKYIEETFPGCPIQTTKDGYKDVPDVGAYINDDGTLYNGRVSFLHEGKKIEIIFDNERAKLPLEQKIHAPAPISAIAMDRFGTVVADKNFEDHAKRRIYQPYEADNWGERDPCFQKLSKKIPGLLCVNGQGFAPLRSRLRSMAQTAPEAPVRISRQINSALRRTLSMR
jgi:hypothetical protein